MNTRMEKYESSIDRSMSRAARNQELYQTIGKSDIDNYEIKSNATVLGSNNKNQIDVEQIKKILDTRYNEAPKRKSIRLDSKEEIKEVIEETTKEYDINAVIEKAKNDKPLSYEEERIKKLRDTQFNILNNLDLGKDSSVDKKEEETKLLELINTITLNEDKNKKVNPELDLFSDLKGDDNTEVFDGMKEEVAEKLNHLTEEETEQSINLDNTAFSKSMDFTKKDFEEFDIETEKTGIFGKILIALVLIAFVVGIIFFVKSVFNV